MGWSDIWDTVGKVGDWYSRNSDVIDPIAKFGYNYYANSQKDAERRAIEKELQDIEAQRYANAQAQYSQYMDYQNQVYQQAAAGGGGGGGSSAPNFQPAIAALDPYAKWGPSLMRMAVKQNRQGNKALNQVAKSLMTPETMATISQQSVPAYAIPIDLPAYLKR